MRASNRQITPHSKTIHQTPLHQQQADGCGESKRPDDRSQRDQQQSRTDAAQYLLELFITPNTQPDLKHQQIQDIQARIALYPCFRQSSTRPQQATERKKADHNQTSSHLRFPLLEKPITYCPSGQNTASGSCHSKQKCLSAQCRQVVDNLPIRPNRQSKRKSSR